MTTRATRAKLTTAPAVADEPLHIKYRPRKLEDVRGQDAVVSSVQKMLKSSTRAHAYLFVGPAGTGKTTLARILMHALGVTAGNVTEVDAATNNGIDAMRDLTAPLRYQGFGESPLKGLIIDEAHAISKQAWQSLLKSVEEPPAHVFWAFCTTEDGKIPDTISSRCTTYRLKSFNHDDLMDLLEFVCDQEKFNTPDSTLKAVARAADGSPRRALVQLGMVHACEHDEDVARLLATPLENKEVIDLCRLLLDRKLTWTKLTATLKALELDALGAESVRIVVANYLAAVLMNAKSDSEAQRLLDVLYSFSKPFPSSDKLAPLLLAFGDAIFRGD